jgi:hypothetical protein
VAGSRKITDTEGLSRLTVLHPVAASEPQEFAARELADSLTIMLDEKVGVAADSRLPPRHLRLAPAQPREAVRRAARPSAPTPLEAAPPQIPAGREGFALWREALPPGGPNPGMQRGALLLAGSTDSALLHGVYDLLEGLGARFPLGAAPSFPRCAGAGLDLVEARTSVSAFGRRAFASDLMTWHYENADRLATHLAHDRRFIPWMGARGLNAFSYIRHRVDRRLKIEELISLHRGRGIASEYGGHVLQLLLPRESFARDPELFPVNSQGERDRNGNLCASNAKALAIVCDRAIGYLRESPECALLHIWGADVAKGAWCRCGECSQISPQRQYMRVVNAVADAVAAEMLQGPPVAYLAYHDTIEPDPLLRPRPNVSFEWAPRERCYSHAIDDEVCEVNPRYLESLKRYLELFDGRGHVFEYYADAILFGGLACVTPAVIASDLRAYIKLGVTSISCLTFGEHSVLAYPVNLEAFARGTHSPNFEPDRVLADSVTATHPQCASEMVEIYRAISRASALILDGGGEMMRPRLQPTPSRRRILELEQAHSSITRALAAADTLLAKTKDTLAASQRDVWHYSREAIGGIIEYVTAARENGVDRQDRARRAVDKIGASLVTLRAAGPAAGNTWASWDLEWISDLWLDALRRRFDDAAGIASDKS